MRFDATISLGSIIAAASIVGTLLMLYWRAALRWGKLELQVHTMWEWWLDREGEQTATIVREVEHVVRGILSHVTLRGPRE